MKQHLSHILDKSACITKRQLDNYLNGTMAVEECHAFEHHTNGCAFCSDALDGAMAHTTAETLAASTSFNNNFITAHFSLHFPEVHLNSMGPAITTKKDAKRTTPLWLKTSIAAVVIVGAVAMLFFQGVKPFGTHAFKRFTSQKVAEVASPVGNASVAAK